MYLRTSENSPFGRKCRIAIAHLSLADRVEIRHGTFADPEDPIHEENPLGKVPALVTGNGERLIESALIIEYLNAIVGGDLLPADPDARRRALQVQVVADGAMAAGLLISMERRMRSETQQSDDWVRFQKRKVDNALAWLERANLDPARITVATIATACAIDWLTARKLTDWFAGRPALHAWLAQFAQHVPSFAQTALPGSK